MAKPFVIGDPVHRYLRVAAHERIVIDHPITQRLRRITQTGLAEFVYPEARTSRFIHSLGAMHLASRFVIVALENAETQDVREFFQDIASTFGNSYTCTDADRESLLADDDGNSTGGLAACKAVFKDKDLQHDSSIRGWLGLIEAAVRLAALFHDLGHLPFSHDFEFAFKSYIQEQRKNDAAIPSELADLARKTPHEAVGHKLADIVFKSIISQRQDKPAVRSAYLLAKMILDEEPNYGTTEAPRINALGWLHSLIDGDIDVDRADYLLRDGRALGLDFATYNLDQLAHNVVLARDQNRGFFTAVDERGFSALESYCLARARSNQVIIRHHKCAQIGAAFRLASAEALKSADAQLFLRELGEIVSTDVDAKRVDSLLNSFAKHDDPWWISVLRKQNFEGNPLMDAALNLVLERRPTFRSLWKRKGELTEEQRRRLNQFKELSRDQPVKFEKQVRKLREEDQVLVAIHNFKPYSVLPDGERSQMMVKTKNGIEPASALSPLIRSLHQAWQEDVHIHAFALKESHLTIDQLIEKMTSVLSCDGNPRQGSSKSRKVTVVSARSTRNRPQKSKKPARG